MLEMNLSLIQIHLQTINTGTGKERFGKNSCERIVKIGVKIKMMEKKEVDYV